MVSQAPWLALYDPETVQIIRVLFQIKMYNANVYEHLMA